MRVRPGQKVTPQEQRRPGLPVRRPRTRARRPRHADFAFFHRPADLRRGGLDRDRDPRRGGVHAPADRAISGDRAAGHQRVGPVSRRQRRDRGLDRGRADRGADQRRRAHALRVVELQRRRPLLDRRDVRHRHRPRYRAGAGAEPRLHRAAAPAGGRAQHRCHRRQGLVRPDDGRAHAVARQVAERAVHLQLRHSRDQGRADPRAGRRLHRGVRQPRLFDAGLARSRPFAVARPDRERRRRRVAGPEHPGCLRHAQPAAGRSVPAHSRYRC